MAVPCGGLGGLPPPQSQTSAKLSKKNGINYLDIPQDRKIMSKPLPPQLLSDFSELAPRGTSLIGISVRDFFRTKGFIRIFDGFFLKTKGFCRRCTRFLGVKCPSAGAATVRFVKVTGYQTISFHNSGATCQIYSDLMPN